MGTSCSAQRRRRGTERHERKLSALLLKDSPLRPAGPGPGPRVPFVRYEPMMRAHLKFDLCMLLEGLTAMRAGVRTAEPIWRAESELASSDSKDISSQHCTENAIVAHAQIPTKADSQIVPCLFSQQVAAVHCTESATARQFARAGDAQQSHAVT